mgnify:CR=1 FL=1
MPDIHRGYTGLYGFPICGVGYDIKGATRALPPGHPLLPEIYQGVGQPVLIPEDMGTYSYVLAGAEGARTQSFGGFKLPRCKQSPEPHTGNENG